jgi:hypothetical protein
MPISTRRSIRRTWRPPSPRANWRYNSTVTSSAGKGDTFERRGANERARATGECAQSRLSDSVARSDDSSDVTGLVHAVVSDSSRSRTVAGLAKLVLDFLLRPATMTSRQHSGARLYIRRGKLARRRQYHAAREGTCMGGMVYARAAARRHDTNRRWHRRNDWERSRRAAARRRIYAVRVEIATDAGKAGTPTNDCRDSVLHTRERAHALNHEAAID